MSWVDIYAPPGGRCNKGRRTEESKHVALGLRTATSRRKFLTDKQTKEGDGWRDERNENVIDIPLVSFVQF